MRLHRIDSLGELRNRHGFEDGPHRKVDLQPLPDARYDLHAEQGVSSHGKEVVLHADRGDAQ